MQRSPIVCPKCETEFVLESKPRKSRAPKPEETVAKPKVVVAEVDEIEVEGVEEIEDDEDEDDALLPDEDEDEDDLNDVGIGGTPGEDEEDV
jgi:hypothetical protein